MDDPFRLGLSRVKRLDRVGVVMAENSRRVDRVAPLLRAQRCYRSPVPQLGRRDGTAPVVVAHMQHMIAKVLELIVGCLRAIEVNVDVGETQIPPVLSRFAAKLMKGIQRELVVRAGTLPRKQHIEECRGHRRGLVNGGGRQSGFGAKQLLFFHFLPPPSAGRGEEGQVDLPLVPPP